MKKFILAIALLTSSQFTYAACSNASLMGAWVIFGSNNNQYSNAVGKGTVVISSTGVIDSIKSNITYLFPNGNSIVTTTAKLSGKVSVDSQCSVVASITAERTAYTTGTTYTVYGQLDNTDKNIINGIYRTIDYDIGTFNWVKK